MSASEEKVSFHCCPFLFPFILFDEKYTKIFVFWNGRERALTALTAHAWTVKKSFTLIISFLFSFSHESDFSMS